MKSKVNFWSGLMVVMVTAMLMLCQALPGRGATSVAAKDLTQVTNMLGSEYAVVVVGTNARLIKITDLVRVLNTNGIAITNFDTINITNKITWNQGGTGQFHDWRLGDGNNSAMRHDWVSGGLNAMWAWYDFNYGTSNRMLTLESTAGNAYKLKMWRPGGYVDGSNFEYGGIEMTTNGMVIGTYYTGSLGTNGQVVYLVTQGTNRVTVTPVGNVYFSGLVGMGIAPETGYALKLGAGTFSAAGEIQSGLGVTCSISSGYRCGSSSQGGSFYTTRQTPQNGGFSKQDLWINVQQGIPGNNTTGFLQGGDFYLNLGAGGYGASGSVAGGNAGNFVVYLKAGGAGIGGATNGMDSKFIVYSKETNAVYQVAVTSKSLTNNTAQNVFLVNCPTGGVTGFTIDYGISSTDATDFSQVTGLLTVSAVNKAGTITLVATESGQAIADSGVADVTDAWAGASATSTNILLQVTANHAALTNHVLRINKISVLSTNAVTWQP